MKTPVLLRKRNVGRQAGTPRMNTEDLVMLTVSGQIAHPTDRKSPYRLGQDGVPRILTGTGGIVINHRVGDRCLGLAGDHVEPGVSLRNFQRMPSGEKEGPNLALNTYACIGNVAVVLNGPAKQKKGIVTGKHGGVDHVLVDFPTRVLKQLQIGNTLQIYAFGTGLRFPDHPDIAVYNCAPALVRRWGLRSRPPRLEVPVTHTIPAALMGSGLGRDNAARGDYDIQLFNPGVNKWLGLNTLRFGDIVAIVDADTRFGRSYRRGFLTIGIVVHGDSTVSGHGPGVVTLLTGNGHHLRLLKDSRVNLAAILGLRKLPEPRNYSTLLDRWGERAPERRSTADNDHSDANRSARFPRTPYGVTKRPARATGRGDYP